MKVFVVGNEAPYVSFWEKWGHTAVDDIYKADILQFTGGEDVSPNYYGAKKHPTTMSSPARDVVEEGYFNLAIENNIPMVGICRGGQFLNIMSGGEMYQHVSGHTKDHYIRDVETGHLILASSTHHQMMKPSDSAVMVATANEGGFKTYWDREKGEFVTIRDHSIDTEVLFYPLTQCLCFQPHAEFSQQKYEGLQTYFFSLVNSLFGVKA